MIRNRACQLGELLGRWFRDPIGCWAEFVEKRTRDRQNLWLQELNSRLSLTPPPPAAVSPPSQDGQQNRTSDRLKQPENVLPAAVQQGIDLLKRLAGRIAYGANLAMAQIRKTLGTHTASVLRRALDKASNDRANETARSAIFEVAGQASSSMSNAATAAGGGNIITGDSEIIFVTTINSSQINSTCIALSGEIDCESSTLSLISCTVDANQIIGTTVPDSGMCAIGGSVTLTNSFASAS